MEANLKFLCQVAVHEVSLIRIFGNSTMYKMSFFKEEILEWEFLPLHKLLWYFLVVTWIFFRVSLFCFAPWCVLVEKSDSKCLLCLGWPWICKSVLNSRGVDNSGLQLSHKGDRFVFFTPCLSPQELCSWLTI